MRFFDHGRSSEPEAETPGQHQHCWKAERGCKPLGAPWETKGWEKGTEKSTQRTARNATFRGKRLLLPLQRCGGSSCGFAAGDRGTQTVLRAPRQAARWSSTASVLGLNDSTSPPGAPAGLHTSALLLSQSSDVMHYLARRCF